MPRDAARGYGGGDGGCRSSGCGGVAAVGQSLTLTSIVEFYAERLLIERFLIFKATFPCAMSCLTVIGSTLVASIEENDAVLGWRTCRLAVTLHVILVLGAVSGTICHAPFLSAPTDHTVVDSAVVASWNV